MVRFAGVCVASAVCEVNNWQASEPLSQVCSIENHDIYTYIVRLSFLPFDP